MCTGFKITLRTDFNLHPTTWQHNLILQPRVIFDPCYVALLMMCTRGWRHLDWFVGFTPFAADIFQVTTLMQRCYDVVTSEQRCNNVAFRTTSAGTFCYHLTIMKQILSNLWNLLTILHTVYTPFYTLCNIHTRWRMLLIILPHLKTGYTCFSFCCN